MLQLDARRVIEDLRELDRRTGGPRGARRVCWTEEWASARAFLRERLGELPVEVETDSAGNLWAELAGGPRGAAVAVGSHLDSVPEGGWLDGALGVMAGLEVLRACAASTAPLPRAVTLVDWADEEGARFGHSLLGSSAFAGTLAVARARTLRDSEGVRLDEALAAHGIDVDRMPDAGAGRRDRLEAYIELHIEQGPVLDAEDIACAAVLGCAGVERRSVVFSGQGAHAGSTPMDRRSDAAVAAARTIVGLQQIGRRRGGVCTAGRVECEPGIATAVPARATLLVDQRHLEPSALSAMVEDAQALWSGAAAAEGCSVEEEPIRSIDPVPFHRGLVEAARSACRGASGADRGLASGALHDAAELARIVPAAMIFASSTGGVSHAAGEDTPEEHLEQALAAFGSLVGRVIEEGVPA